MHDDETTVKANEKIAGSLFVASILAGQPGSWLTASEVVDKYVVEHGPLNKHRRTITRWLDELVAQGIIEAEDDVSIVDKQGVQRQRRVYRFVSWPVPVY